MTSIRIKLVALAAAAAVAGGAGWLWLRPASAPAPAPAAPIAAPVDSPARTADFWAGRVSLLAGGGEASQFSDPYGVAVDARGTIYVADAGEHNRIRRIAPDGAAVTLAGGKEGYADGPGAQGRFHTPSGIAIDARGNLYVADTGNHAIRKVAPDGTVSTLAGGGVAGSADGKGRAAQFNGPVGVAVDAAGIVYVADTYNDLVRRIEPDGTVTTIAGNGAPGDADGPALKAAFDTPCAVAVDADGALLIADTRNNAIRKLGADGLVSTVARGQEGDRRALLRRPLALARTHDGHLYIAAAGGRILQLTPTTGLDALGDVDQPVQPGYGGDGKVQLFQPRGIAIARGGGLVVTDAATASLHGITPATASPTASAATISPAGTTSSAATGMAAEVTAGANAALAAVPLAAARAAIGREDGAQAGAPGGVAPRATAGASADGAGGAPATGTAGAARRASVRAPMLWPVKPQNAPHEVVGVMGEVRGNFEGESRDHFHTGLDIQADVGQPVVAIAPVKVSDPLPNWGFGSLSEGIALGNISYIHMRVGRNQKNAALDERFQLLRNGRGKPDRVRVRRGARFEAGDILGTINAMAHVHLDYYRQGGALNPLSLPFIGLRDTVAPRIASITLFDASGRVVRAAKRKPLVVRRELGELSIVVDAYDQMDGNEARRRLGLYRLGYQLLRADGSPAPGHERPLVTQIYDQLPRNRDAVKFAYAPSSGITVYGSKATRFAYTLTNRMVHGQVTPGMWDVAGLAPGDYILRVHAADFAGNAAIEGRDLPLTIQ
ncbi:gluconolaconase [Pseudoduganella namucuonensis]|uniref:gluconolaconase n=1 Tax=Pseudoduganella namucuonensis TaxID=1035707 RepID=UPI001E65DBBA|nr:gluconolaconase [Pseudoduganella namucuonensis]